jgi:hypothetical protein
MLFIPFVIFSTYPFFKGFYLQNDALGRVHSENQNKYDSFLCGELTYAVMNAGSVISTRPSLGLRA